MSDPILARVSELLSTPDKWTKHSHARDISGIECSPFSPVARCWCLDGALLRASAEIKGDLPYANDLDLDAGISHLECYDGYVTAGSKLHELVPIAGYVEFNDDPCTTFKDVRQVLNQAIAR